MTLRLSSPVHQTAWLQVLGSSLELVNLRNNVLTIVMCLVFTIAADQINILVEAAVVSCWPQAKLSLPPPDPLLSPSPAAGGQGQCQCGRRDSWTCDLRWAGHR